VPLDSGVRVVQFDFLFVQRGGGVNESSRGSRVFHLTLHRYREEILARGKDARTLLKRFKLFIPTLVSRENSVPWRISWGLQF